MHVDLCFSNPAMERKIRKIRGEKIRWKLGGDSKGKETPGKALLS